MNVDLIPTLIENELILKRWKIRVKGVVQGVGFRPFIYKLAAELKIVGSVWNDQAGVMIDAIGFPSSLEQLKSLIKHDAPPLAVVGVITIVEQNIDEIPSAFTISESVKFASVSSWVSPDYDVCQDCLREMRHPEDRRYSYPFINCTNCGPRYSIIRGMPYDRKNTTMHSFEMCTSCRTEYLDPTSRRFHAQPIACAECGPTLKLVGPEEFILTSEHALAQAKHLLKSGSILGVKSVGGFHLAVRANDIMAVQNLRRRKRRDSKPFAVMVRDLTTAHKWAEITKSEAEALSSSARPIVLLKKKLSSVSESIAPRNPMIGIMLPSAPLHYLLLDDLALDSLVMTSGNVSGKPICYEDGDALHLLDGIADYLLMHNRPIQRRVDDSVVRITQMVEGGEPCVIFLRRSRGYAPFPISTQFDRKKILAYGAELKTTIAVSKGKDVFVSQHIGDLKNSATFESHQQCAQDLCELNDIQPDVVACDMHPLFTTTKAAIGNAKLPIVQVQHHHAHMASCMAENNLQGLTLGVIFDGTGYGEDGTIWGGEFLVGDYSAVKRVATIRSIKLLGGDAAVKDPTRIAVSLLCDAFAGIDQLAEFRVCQRIGAERVKVYEAMHRRGINSISCTSMGRLFDGVASIIGVCDSAEYEAQGPIELEGLLGRDSSLADTYNYALDLTDEGIHSVDYRAMIRQVVRDLEDDVSLAVISRKFHSTIVGIICSVCCEISTQYQVRQIVLSGGVFMNEFLLVNSYKQLKEAGLDPFFHKQLPPNDANISYGQISVALSLM